MKTTPRQSIPRFVKTVRDKARIFTMLRLVLCVAVLACVSVDAWRGQTCRKHCPNGFEPGFVCVCREQPGISPCDLKSCPTDSRCEVRGHLAICVGVSPIFPVDPIHPIEPIVPIDPILPIDPVFPIDPIHPIDVCYLPKTCGPCRASIPRYHFNSASGRCEMFIYGGCGGNENNFRTYQECSLRCDQRRPIRY